MTLCHFGKRIFRIIPSIHNQNYWLLWETMTMHDNSWRTDLFELIVELHPMKCTRETNELLLATEIDIIIIWRMDE